MTEASVPTQSRRRKIVTGALWGTAGVILATTLVGGYIAFLVAFSLDLTSGDITIVQPTEGTIVATSTAVIRGTVSPDSADVYVAMDDGRRSYLHVDADGNWFYRVTLSPGPNTFTFYVDYVELESESVTVIYRPD